MGSTGRPWKRFASPAKRLSLVIVGVALVAGAAYVAFHVIPGQMHPQPGQTTVVREEARVWTPEESWQETIRERVVRLDGSAAGLVVEERLDTAASPRGDTFELPTDEALRVDGEPGVRAGFPPTPLFRSPPEAVHVGVPWEGVEADPIGAVDTFRWMGTEERDGITLVRYHARHASQAFLHEDRVWYRQTDRTALVEPVTGIVVDYRDHETLSSKRDHTDHILGGIRDDLADRERVWEATVQPTPASQAAMLDQAAAARDEHVEDLLVSTLPVLLAGEAAIGAGIIGRPRRWLAPET